MAVLTNLRKAANHPLLLRNHYSNDIIAKMSIDILQVNGPTCTCIHVYLITVPRHSDTTYMYMYMCVHTPIVIHV